MELLKAEKIKVDRTGGKTAWGYTSAVWFRDAETGQRYYAGPFWSSADAKRYAKALKRGYKIEDEITTDNYAVSPI